MISYMSYVKTHLKIKMKRNYFSLEHVIVIEILLFENLNTINFLIQSNKFKKK